MQRSDPYQEFDARKKKQAEDQQIRWEKWQRDQKEAEQRAREWSAYWERRRQDDRDLWRDKDFANAVDKASRAGYQGKHGHFTVPEEKKLELDALYMQVTVGDYDGNTSIKCHELWQTHKGKTRIAAQQQYIHLTNRMLTRYGWNPPEGWN